MDKFEELKEPCKTLIEKGICLGCSALENPKFTGHTNCSNISKAKESINQIKKNLGVKNENIK